MVFGLLGAQAQDTTAITIITLVVSVLFFLVGAAAIALGIYLLVQAGKNKRLQFAEYQRLVQGEIAEHQRIQGDWKKAMERWDRLYYCGRDDCVFIPGENSSASISKMKEYLFK